MARYTGKDGTVTAGGVTIGFVSAWTLRQSPSFVKHIGADSHTVTVLQGVTSYSGTITVEADASDAAQTTLRQTTPVTATLHLLEKTGEGWTVTDALVWPAGNGIRRNAKVSRNFSFIDTGTVGLI